MSNPAAIHSNVKCLGITVMQPSARKKNLCVCFLGCLNESLEILVLKGMCFATG